MNVLKGELVVVLSGNHKGEGPVKVLSVGRRKGVVTLDGVNRRLRHVKRGHAKSPQGGRIELCLPIDISNVAPFCKVCNRGVSVRFRLAECRKIRVCSVCDSQF